MNTAPRKSKLNKTQEVLLKIAKKADKAYYKARIACEEAELRARCLDDFMVKAGMRKQHQYPQVEDTDQVDDTE